MRAAGAGACCGSGGRVRRAGRWVGSREIGLVSVSDCRCGGGMTRAALARCWRRRSVSERKEGREKLALTKARWWKEAVVTLVGGDPMVATRILPFCFVVQM